MPRAQLRNTVKGSMLGDMGDKSPKSARKRADQKQIKTNEDDRKKQEAATAKQVVPTKKK